MTIFIDLHFLFTNSWKWNTTEASRKSLLGHFIHLMLFYWSLDIQMYPKYPHFWAFWSSQNSHRCCICPFFMFVPQSRSISLLYRILLVYYSSFYKRNQLSLICVLVDTFWLTNVTIMVELRVLWPYSFIYPFFLLRVGNGTHLRHQATLLWVVFIHLMIFYWSLDIQTYPKYSHFWAFWSSQPT